MQKHMQQMEKMHFKMLWVHFANIMLGAWLLSSPILFSGFTQTAFSDTIWQVTNERDLWTPVLRLRMGAWNDVTCGILIMIFGFLSLSQRFSWAQWANTAVGVWLLFAPLIFWTPSPEMYLNDTLVGALVIAFAILVPMMPGMSHKSMMDQSDLPVGWNYNPSTYLQRMPPIALGLFGFLIARYLAAYQLGHIDNIWDPFFSGEGAENGTEQIITSSVSKAWPIADAGLGAVTYMFEVLMGLMGDRRRWRTMPWMVGGFGVAVVPLGVISIYFIIIQPIMIGTWCTLCLATALAMVIMIPYSLDEIVAMCQYMVQAVKRGENFWFVFFRGSNSPESGIEEHKGFHAPPREVLKESFAGNSIPWTLHACTALGVFLMFTRPLFDAEPPMADSDHLMGALIITFSISAWAEVARPVRFLNIPVGLWLIASPWILSGASFSGSVAVVMVGLAIIVLSLPLGKRSQYQYGNWNRFVR